MSRPDDSAQAGLYNQHGMMNEYTLVPGVCVLPLAEDPPTSETELAQYSPVVVLRLHAPYRVRHVVSKSEKVNNPPVVSSPGDTGAFVFVGGTLSFGNTINATYRNFDWEVGAEYLYVENCVSRTEDGFVLGSPPFTWESAALNLGLGGAPPVPQIGAISQAGVDVRIGVVQGDLIVGVGGYLNDSWGYNVSSYYPGTLFSDDLFNSGPGVP